MVFGKKKGYDQTKDVENGKAEGLDGSIRSPTYRKYSFSEQPSEEKKEVKEKEVLFEFAA